LKAVRRAARHARLAVMLSGFILLILIAEVVARFLH
jgi:hypothetical protein